MAQNNIKPSEVSQVLLQQLKDIDTSLHFEEIGKVLQVSDGVARMYGLTNAEAGELLEFESGVMGVVMNLEQDNVGAVLLGPTDEVKEGMIMMVVEAMKMENNIVAAGKAKVKRIFVEEGQMVDNKLQLLELES